MENGPSQSNALRGEKPSSRIATPSYLPNGDFDRPQPSPRLANNLAVNRSPKPKRNYTGRKLVLHFDVRNTILVADSVDNISVEQALNSFLTGVTWGRQTSTGWEWYSDHPSLQAPHPDAITYYKHLETQTVKVPSDRVRLRRMTGDFTQEAIGRKFRPYFEKCLKNLRWPYNGGSDKTLTMSGNDGGLYHYILPAFYKLLHHLNQNNREFAIVIRTYGLDARNVLLSMRQTIQQGKHPQFQEPLPIEVNTIPGKVHRKGEVISMEVHSDTTAAPAVLKDERTIYNHLSSSSGISAYQDDFIFWQTNGYGHHCAKPLWLDPTQHNVHHIFFDDNIRVLDTDSIVDVRVFDSASSGKARTLNRHDAAKFENMCLVQADLLESTNNIDYFINKVNGCERLYNEFLQSVGRR